MNVFSLPFNQLKNAIILHINDLTSYIVTIFNCIYICQLQIFISTISLPPIGVAVIFAQFPISQFTSIAWFSAGIGVAIIFIQILIFKGEMKCQTNIRHVSICSCKKIKQIPLPKIISASKLLFLTVSFINQTIFGSSQMDI